MEAYKTEAILDKNGGLTIEKLPFQAGQRVEIIVLAASPNIEDANLYPLQGTPYRYDDPFEPATDIEDWEVLK